MHVLEHQHRRPVTGNRFDEAPDREEQGLAIGDRAFAVEAEQDCEVAGHLLGLRRSEQIGGLRMQFLQGGLDRIALEDAAELLDLGGKGAVGAAVAIRERAPPDGASV